jgi:hypothetical protein
MAGARRFVYNLALASRRDHYRESGETLKRHELSAQLTQLKLQPETAWLRTCDSQVLQQALADCDRAFQHFFARRSRFPQFKSRKHPRQSFRIPQRVKIEDGRCYVPKVGWVRLRPSRPVEGTPKSATFVLDPCGHWHVGLVTEFELALLRQRNFVLLGIGFLSSLVSPFFYNFSFLFLTDPNEVGFAASTANWAQSLGQVAEVVVLLGLAASLKRLGMKRILLLGVGAQMLRFSVYALGEPVWLVVAAMTLHGLVFTFFFTGLAIAVENLSKPEYRASAQGLMSFVRGGIGSLCGNLFAGWVYDRYALPGGGHDWEQIFLFPACITFCSLLAFALLFRERRGAQV